MFGSGSEFEGMAGLGADSVPSLVGLAGVAPGYTPPRPASRTPPVRVTNPHHYAYLTETNFVAPASVQPSIKIVDAGASARNYLAIRNQSTTDAVYFSFGRQASTSSVHFVAPGQLVGFDQVIPQGDLWVISGGAAAGIAVAYSNT